MCTFIVVIRIFEVMISSPHRTSLKLVRCEYVSDDGLQALAGLTALTDLNLSWCFQVSEDGLRALVGLTHLTHRLTSPYGPILEEESDDGSHFDDFVDHGYDSEEHNFYGDDGYDGYESEGELYDW